MCGASPWHRFSTHKRPPRVARAQGFAHSRLLLGCWAVPNSQIQSILLELKSKGWGRAHDDLRCAIESSEPRLSGSFQNDWGGYENQSQPQMSTVWQPTRTARKASEKVVPSSFYKDGCACGETQLHLAKKHKFEIVFNVVRHCSKCPWRKRSFLQIPKCAIKCSKSFQNILGNQTTLDPGFRWEPDNLQTVLELSSNKISHPMDGFQGLSEPRDICAKLHLHVCIFLGAGGRRHVLIRFSKISKRESEILRTDAL